MAVMEKMKPGDIEVCRRIYLDAFNHNDITAEAFNLENYFSKFIESDTNYAFVYKENNIVIGFITVIKIPSLVGDFTHYIDVVAVAPYMQNKGYGTSMMKEYFKKYSKDEMVWLTPMKDSTSCKLYDALGMVQFSNSTYYCYLPKSDELENFVDCIRSDESKSVEQS